MSDFQGKNALVTGASGGIGSACARAFAAAGANVGVGYNHGREAANQLVDEFRAAGAGAIGLRGNLARQADARDVADKMNQEFGAIDILVNCAGTLQHIPFGSVTEQNFAEQFESNVLSAAMMMQEAARHFPESGAKVVNIATNISESPLPSAALYCGAKAALATISEAFAKELGARQVNVNCVAPGATETPMTDWLDEETRQRIISQTPLGRFAKPDDIADIVLFLCSPAARWITGRSIIADGGLI